MNTYKVVADYIDETQFSFICPFCSTAGNTRRHLHGNRRDFCSTRWEHRVSNCDNYKGEFKILICNETRRKLSRANKKIYHNYLKEQGYI